MALHCPQCDSENVQAVRVILDSGTSFNSGTVTGVAVGSNGGGTFVGTSGSTSQTTLAARFSPPVKPALWAVIALGLLPLVTSPWLAASGPDAAWRYMNLALWAVFAHAVWSYRRKSAAYKEHLPKWKALHDHGFFCHRCGHTFMTK
ncbi:MAG: hypothetical protein QM569_07805 [Acidovorax sp.]|uniref:hypothetical protein n=1 Tax=Acidovorax sp. TaxID=1872122 RepID=UPI0039E3F672